MAEAVRVAVRVRPPCDGELADAGACPAVRVERTEGLQVTVHASTPESFAFDFGYGCPCRSPSSSSRDVPERVTLGSSASGPVSQKAASEAAFADIGQAIVQDALNGYSCSVLAYGQRGSGKSTALLGTAGQIGLACQCVKELVSRRAGLEAGDVGGMLHVRMSCVQLHNERVRDLLSASPETMDLDVIDHPVAGACVPGLTEAVCQTAGDVQRLLDYSRKRQARLVAQLRAAPARSHTLVLVKVERVVGSRPRGDGVRKGQVLSARMLFADLAGSEFQGGRMQGGGTPVERGLPVDPGLAALASAVLRLSEGRHTSCRESTLTTLLKETLAGRSRSYLVACVSPLEQDAPETLATLRFATLVRHIRTSPRQNVDVPQQVVTALTADIERLRGHMANERVGLDMDVQNELRTVELLVGHLTASRESFIESSQILEEEQAIALARMGLFSQSGGGDSTPYLLNMSHDPMLEGCLVHFLPKNQPTTIGAAEGNTVPMRGLSIPQHLCKITNRGNTELNIMKVSPGGRLAVNGRLMSEGEVQKLRHGDKVYVGRAHAVRVIVPAEKSQDVDVSLSLRGLEEEWASVAGSPVWESLSDYLEQVRAQMQPAQAQRLFEDMRQACQLVDEANELTADCRPDDGLHFEVDLTSAVPSSVVVRVLQADGLGEEGEEALGAVLYLWSLPVMAERLEQMREYHESKALGECLSLDPLLDPWQEPQPGALSQRLSELELSLTLEREASARHRRWRLDAGRRQLRRCAELEEQACLRELLGAWGACARTARRAREKAEKAVKAPSSPVRPLSPPKTRAVASPERVSSPLKNRTAPASPERASSPPKGRLLPEPPLPERAKSHKPSFDFNYRGGFKAGAVKQAASPRAFAAATLEAKSRAAQASTPLRSSSVQKPRQPQQMQQPASAPSRKPRGPASPRGERPAGELAAAAAGRGVAGGVAASPCGEVLEPSFLSSDGRSTAADEESYSAMGMVMAGDLEASDFGVSRFVSGIVTGSSFAEEELNLRSVETETKLLKRQLEQAWQLRTVLKSQLPTVAGEEPVALQELPAARPEPTARQRPMVAPPLPEWQAGRQAPWTPQAGPASPRHARTPDVPASGQLEGLSTLPRCVLIHTTAAVVPSRSWTEPIRRP